MYKLIKQKSNLILLVIIATTLSSCIGNTENTMSATNEFAVVKQGTNGLLYLTPASNINITWDGINKYIAGDALVVSYEVGSDNFVNTNTIKANYVNVSETYPMSSQKVVTATIADTSVNVKNQEGLSALEVLSSSPIASLFNDRWLIAYSYFIKEGESLDLNFFYDKTKQELKTGVELPANSVIIDIITTKKGEAIGSSASKATKNIVVNFSSLRNILAKDMSGNVIVYFRFSKLGSDSKYANYYQNVGSIYYNAS